MQRPCLWVSLVNIVRTSTLPRLINMFNEKSLKIQESCFMGIDRLVPQFLLKGLVLVRQEIRTWQRGWTIGSNLWIIAGMQAHRCKLGSHIKTRYKRWRPLTSGTSANSLFLQWPVMHRDISKTVLENKHKPGKRGRLFYSVILSCNLPVIIKVLSGERDRCRERNRTEDAKSDQQMFNQSLFKAWKQFHRKRKPFQWMVLEKLAKMNLDLISNLI